MGILLWLRGFFLMEGLFCFDVSFAALHGRILFNQMVLCMINDC